MREQMDGNVGGWVGELVGIRMLFGARHRMTRLRRCRHAWRDAHPRNRSTHTLLIAGARMCACQHSASEAELKLIFKLVDTDHSGYMSADELLALGKAINPRFSEKKCLGLMDKMDTSRDGHVSESEFVALVSNIIADLPAASQEAGMKAMRVAAEGLARWAEDLRKQATQKAKEAWEEEAQAALAAARMNEQVDQAARRRAEAEKEARERAVAEEARRVAEDTRSQAAATALAKHSASEAELKLIFKLVDTDHSGYMSAGELLALGKAINPRFSGKKCRGLMDKMDTSRDGHVSESEFVALVSNFISGLQPKNQEAGMKAMRDAAHGLHLRLCEGHGGGAKR